MKYLFIMFMFFNSGLFAGDTQLNDVRLLFQKSATNQVACKKLLADLFQYNESNNSTLAAYKACATMMMANYLFNPVSKLSNFNQGKNLLEKCINADKANIEIRYLRFAIQSNSPAFLGCKNSMKADKIFLINAISGLKDLNLKEIIIKFLNSSDYLDSSEKQNIKS